MVLHIFQLDQSHKGIHNMDGASPQKGPPNGHRIAKLVNNIQ